MYKTVLFGFFNSFSTLNCFKCCLIQLDLVQIKQIVKWMLFECFLDSYWMLIGCFLNAYWMLFECFLKYIWNALKCFEMLWNKFEMIFEMIFWNAFTNIFFEFVFLKKKKTLKSYFGCFDLQKKAISTFCDKPSA